MTEAIRRRRARKGTFASPGATHATGRAPSGRRPKRSPHGAPEPVAAPSKDLSGDDVPSDAWLLDRDADDVQRGGGS